MTGTYILDKNKLAVPASIEEWGRFLKNPDRKVASETIGGYVVSTMFIGIDHNFSGKGDPLLFETMIFKSGPGLESTGYQERCSTWEEAIEMHEQAVAHVIAEVMA